MWVAMKLAVSRWRRPIAILEAPAGPLGHLEASAGLRTPPDQQAVSDARVLATRIQRPAPDRPKGRVPKGRAVRCWHRSPGSWSRTACCGLGGVLAMSGTSCELCMRPRARAPARARARACLRLPFLIKHCPLARVGEGGAVWVGGAEQTRHRLDARGEMGKRCAGLPAERARARASGMRGRQHVWLAT